MKIKKLNLINFRHIKNQIIEFGDNLTVIAGQNSTGKSSILGRIAQAFHYNGKEYTINNKPYHSKYSEVFRFCSEKDYKNQYEIILEYDENEEECKTKTMKTRFLPKTEKGQERYKVDYDGRSNAINNVPVIYLGLKRLIPLATDGEIRTSTLNLDEAEIKEFGNIAKDILILLDKNISPEQIKSKSKEFLAMQTDKYNHLGNSAGQDNIGQILTAIFSLKRLNKGGILLIDEIDATLYAGSQIQLIKYLYKVSKRYDIQIIFTTHSLEILEHTLERFSLEKLENNKNKPIIINFLELKDGLVENKINPSINELKDKIKVQTSQTKKIEKTKILCEDNFGKTWCQNLISGSKLSNKLEIMGLGESFGYGDLAKMATSKHSFFKEIRFVLDGDCRKQYEKKPLPRTIFLPGNDTPEKIFYDFLISLSDKDDFWENDNNFTKQVCFNGFQNADNKESFKLWFKTNADNKYFGERAYSKLLNKWKAMNINEVKQFQLNLKNIVY